MERPALATGLAPCVLKCVTRAIRTRRVCKRVIGHRETGVLLTTRKVVQSQEMVNAANLANVCIASLDAIQFFR